MLSYQQMLAVMSPSQVANMQSMNKDFKNYCDEIESRSKAGGLDMGSGLSQSRKNVPGQDFNPDTDLGSTAGSAESIAASDVAVKFFCAPRHGLLKIKNF